jgi:hypothetical protein
MHPPQETESSQSGKWRDPQPTREEAPQTHPHEVEKLEYVLGPKAAESDCQSSLCVQSCATQTDIVVLRSLHTHQAVTSTSSQSSCAAHGAEKR